MVKKIIDWTLKCFAVVFIVALMTMIIYFGRLFLITFNWLDGLAFLFFCGWLIVFIRQWRREFSWEDFVPHVGFFVSTVVAGSILFFMLGRQIYHGVPFQYQWQRKYAAGYGYVGALFPREIPKNAENYCLEFWPTILQGGGALTVYFTTDEEYAVACEERAGEIATLTFSLREYLEQCFESTDMEQLTKEQGRVKNSGIHLVVPDKVRKQYPNAKVYLINSNFDRNHPQGQWIVVDRDAGFVMFGEE